MSIYQDLWSVYTRKRWTLTSLLHFMHSLRSHSTRIFHCLVSGIVAHLIFFFLLFFELRTAHGEKNPCEMIIFKVILLSAPTIHEIAENPEMKTHEPCVLYVCGFFLAQNLFSAFFFQWLSFKKMYSYSHV